MPNNATNSINFARQSQLWQAIGQIPEDVLTDYLADNIIDDHEIEDITLRLESHISIHISADDHDIIRQMVRQAVEHIQRQMSTRLEDKLCPSTLSDIRQAMAGLVQSGQIKLAVADASITANHAPSASIPDERPSDYDETALNLID